jgi:prepilin-type N-terminal cleavage/methylation domain-containing protein
MTLRPEQNVASAEGFSLLELLVASVIFLIVMGTAFTLLNVAVMRHRSEQEFLDVFQNARAGVDQMERDIHQAGYPSPYSFAGTPTDPLTAPTALQQHFAIPFVGRPTQTCQVGLSCTIPSGFDLLLEADINPENPLNPGQVQWIEYRLVPDGSGVTSTLMRKVAPKTPGADPTLVGTWAPFVENVLNDPTSVDPNQGIFNYQCDPPAPCTPAKISQVNISLRVRSPRPDLQTRGIRDITLRATVRRVNPYP